VFLVRIFSCSQPLLKQEDLDFLKAISAARKSPALLRELRKALSASKEKRAVALQKASGSAKAASRRGESSSKRKASQSGMDYSTEPALRRPAPELASRSSSCANTAAKGQVLSAAWKSRDQRMPR
jgi:hypothetical protein